MNFWMQTASVKNWYKQVLSVLAWGEPWNIIRGRAGRIIGPQEFYIKTDKDEHAAVEIQTSLKGTVHHDDIFLNSKSSLWTQVNYNPNNP